MMTRKMLGCCPLSIKVLCIRLIHQFGLQEEVLYLFICLSVCVSVSVLLLSVYLYVRLCCRIFQAQTEYDIEVYVVRVIENLNSIFAKDTKHHMHISEEVADALKHYRSTSVSYHYLFFLSLLEMGLDPMDKDFIGLHSVCISSSFKLKSVLSMYMTGRKAECVAQYFFPQSRILASYQNLSYCLIQKTLH